MRQILDRAARDGACTLAVLLAIVFAFWPAHAHEIYTGVHGHDGQWCCNESDCEPAEFREQGGHLLFYSRRHDAWIKVRHDQVTYRALPGDDRQGIQRAHWCGYRRQASGPQAPKNGDDPNFGTYCALLDPGDS